MLRARPPDHRLDSHSPESDRRYCHPLVRTLPRCDKRNMVPRTFALSLMVAALPESAWAAPSQQLPVETFFRNFQYQEVSLSPSGECFAALAPFEKRVGLVVVDLKNHDGKFV